MAPNLFLIYKKAVTPWTWYTPKKSKHHIARKIFHSQEPVPGLYAINAQQKRYLVALKPNGKKDKEHIFKAHPTKEDPQVKSSTIFTKQIEASPIDLGNETIKPTVSGSTVQDVSSVTDEPVIDLASTTEDNDSSEGTLNSNTESSLAQVSSISSVSSTQAVKSAAFVQDSDKTGNTPQSIDHGEQKQNATALSDQEKIHITSSGQDMTPGILENHGVLPHQSQPLRQQNRNASANSLSSFGSNFYKYDTHGIEKVDLDDYSFLRDPLRIEYCLTTKRWMFASEISQRTIITPMCRNPNCMERDMILCGKTVDMELFCLDDAESWVVIGKGNGGYVSKRWEHHLGQNGRLYCVDEETECIRRQIVEEVKASRERLAKNQARFAVFDDEASYMPVVRYLE